MVREGQDSDRTVAAGRLPGASLRPRPNVRPFPAVSDGHIYGRPSHRMRYACSPAEDWPPPLDLSSDGDVDATVLQELYPDSPPG